jgi:tetratricopeptide (TPR) repeat protein
MKKFILVFIIFLYCFSVYAEFKENKNSFTEKIRNNAKKNFINKNYEKAIFYYQKLIEFKKNNEIYESQFNDIFNLALSYYKNHNFQKAKFYFSQTNIINPYDEEILNYIRICNLKLKQNYISDAKKIYTPSKKIKQKKITPFLFSLILPGSGQLKQKKYFRSIFFLGGTSYFFIKSLNYKKKYDDKYDEYKNEINPLKIIDIKKKVNDYDDKYRLNSYITAGLWILNCVDTIVFPKRKKNIQISGNQKYDIKLEYVKKW